MMNFKPVENLREERKVETPDGLQFPLRITSLVIKSSRKKIYENDDRDSA